MENKFSEFIPYARQTVTDEDIQKVIDVLKSPLLTQGPIVKKFEEEIASKTLSKYCVGFNSATSALHIACLSLGLEEGDWLWTSPITFVASSNCGLYCKANIDFVDINPLTGLIDINALSIKLSNAKKNNKLPKILVAVHLAGTSCEMKEIKRLSDIYGFYIVEDASHALGGKYENFPVGSCQHSSICIFSCHPVKIITSGEGGMATTNDPNLYETMQELRSHGITKNSRKFLKKKSGPWYYEQQSLGYNYRISDIHSALGLSQLNRLEEIVSERNKILNGYRKQLKNLPVDLLEIPENVQSSVHLAIIRLRNKDPEYHLHVFKYLKDNGIGVQLHYLPVHLHPYYLKFGFKEGDFPNSEEYSKNAFSLPLFPGFSLEMQKYVVSQLSKSLSK